MADKIPLLKGFMDGVLLKVWCPFCKKYHEHGWPTSSVKKSHRVAHCADSPFRNGGYYIQPYSEKELAF